MKKSASFSRPSGTGQKTKITPIVTSVRSPSVILPELCECVLLFCSLFSLPSSYFGSSAFLPSYDPLLIRISSSFLVLTILSARTKNKAKIAKIYSNDLSVVQPNDEESPMDDEDSDVSDDEMVDEADPIANK